MSDAPRLDHVAIGVPRAEAALPWLVGELGGAEFAAGPGFGFRFFQLAFARGGVIELLEPEGPEDGFLHRFLARGGPRVHHVTFKVSSLDEMIARATALGYAIASQDRSDPHWQEAFLHPKQALGIVIQLVEQHARPDALEPAEAKPRPDSARVIGPRLVAPSASAARRQWGELLGGSESRSGEALVFSWPDSPLTITVDVEADAEPGPRWIELSAPRALALPAREVPKLGTRFVQR